MSKRTSLLRILIALIVLIATISLFTTYYIHHPEVRHQLVNTPSSVFAWLLVLYACFVGSLALINHATLRLAGASLGRDESVLLTIYSSIVNFFGPLQSGPAFRAIYLKQKYNLSLKNYTVATFMYYGFYAIFSGLFLISGLLGWWLLVISLVAAVIFGFFYKTQAALRDRVSSLALTNWHYLAFATFVQICLITAIYFVELHSILSTVSLSQVIVYTGAANFALFVSLTPGAIGFRESFLLFSEKLHHIPSSTIVVANTIDRSVYISILLLLAIGLFGSHANRQFKAYSPRK